MRSLLVVALATLVAGTTEAKGLSCRRAVLLVSGAPLLSSGPAGSDTLMVEQPMVSIQSGCGPRVARLRPTGSGAVLRARWKRCGDKRRVRLRATVSETCTLAEGTLRYTVGRRRQHRTFVATAAPAAPITCNDPSTLAAVERRIFAARGCNVASCHGVAQSGGLDLRPGRAYTSLVGAAASGATGRHRVVAGDPEASFLIAKLRGTLRAHEGSRMPLTGAPLSDAELGLVTTWIAGGAPADGLVPDSPCLPPPEYVPTPAPAPPPGGFQLVLDGPTLAPGEEQEGCLWIRAPITGDFVAARFEFAMNPGTHHILLYEQTGTVPYASGWNPGDVACTGSGSANPSAPVAGAPEAPYYEVAYPTGVARVLRAGTYLGLNAHYANGFAVPIQIKAWINVHPYQGTPVHRAESFLDLDDMASIVVPPFSQRTQSGRFYNPGPGSLALLDIQGHMHKRGVRFTAWRAGGRTDANMLYESFDWGHPATRAFAPALVLAPGDGIDYECVHDNGVTRGVRRDRGGNPTTLFFGLGADDEMCVLTGTFYRR